MYASVRRYTGPDIERLSELIRERFHTVWERLSERPGFVAYEVVFTPDTVVSITVFETWVTAEESNVDAAAWLRRHAPDLTLDPPQVTSGELYVEPGFDRRPFGPPPRRRWKAPEVPWKEGGM